MKCRKNDYVKFADGGYGKVITGTNKDNGYITVNKYLVKLGHHYTVSENAENIIYISRKGKEIYKA